jgi:hypothetical protein
VPPAYPTRVRITPGRLPNWESGPQNQPRAKVAVANFSERDVSDSSKPMGDTAYLCCMAMLFPP